MTRRTLLAGAAAMALRAAERKIPVGLELYSVRDELAKDLPATVHTVAQMGYQVVEFDAFYFQWTPAYARDVRKVMEDAGLVCLSTHNDPEAFTPRGMAKAIELNQILGSKTIMMASAGSASELDDWKNLADLLTVAAEKLQGIGMRVGYHNHQTEWRAVEGKIPMEVLAAGTPKSVTLQLDVGTCVAAGRDPVAWVQANPGRIRSMHCKDWGAGDDRGYRVLFGEGDAPWTKLLDVAESTGGTEYFLIEQEGSRFPPLEAAQRCLDAWKKLRG